MKNKYLPKKRFGQNFLQDDFVLEKIVAAIKPLKKDHFVEIGPGLGALTKKILPLVAKLDVIEIDRDLIAELEKTFSSEKKIFIHAEDALKFDFSKFKNFRLVGNLPYNISTPLLFHLLNFGANIFDMHFMLQNEVVDRICAKTKTKAYGRLSVMMQYHFDAEKLFEVPPEAFCPMPKVVSAILRLIPKKEKLKVHLPSLEKIAKLSFSHRRKTLFNNLKSLLSVNDFATINIDSSKRAEEISVAEYVKIANLLWKKSTNTQ